MGRPSIAEAILNIEKGARDVINSGSFYQSTLFLIRNNRVYIHLLAEGVDAKKALNGTICEIKDGGESEAFFLASEFRMSAGRELGEIRMFMISYCWNGFGSSYCALIDKSEQGPRMGELVELTEMA